jgi:hypothetical protein
MICYQKNFLTVCEVIVANGLASIHLVKYLTMTIAKQRFLGAVGIGSTRSIAHRRRGQVGKIKVVGAPGLFECVAKS